MKLPPGMHCSLEFRLGAALSLSLFVAPLPSPSAVAVAQSYRRPRRFPALLTARESRQKFTRETREFLPRESLNRESLSAYLETQSNEYPSISCEFVESLSRFSIRLWVTDQLRNKVRPFETRPAPVMESKRAMFSANRRRRIGCVGWIFFSFRSGLRNSRRCAQRLGVCYLYASWPRVETRGSVNRRIASRDTVQKFGGADKQAEARENSEAANRRRNAGVPDHFAPLKLDYVYAFANPPLLREF